jgi:hypothetical protein
LKKSKLFIGKSSVAKILRSAVSVGFALVGIGCAEASESALHVWCNTFTQAEREMVQCHVRSNDGNDPLDATVTSANGRKVRAVLDGYNSAKYTSAWYFLIQQSNVSSAQLAKMSNAVRSFLSFKGNHTFAVASYTGSVEQRPEFSPFEGQIEKVLLDVQVASPSARPPALYKAARAAIYQLGTVSADRKALVLLSDGTNEDDTVTEKDVVELARKNNIIIYGLFFGEKNARPQNISRLAERTFGIDRDFSDESPNDLSLFASNFAQILENGLVLTLDGKNLSQDDELTISAHFREKNLILSAGPVAVHRSMPDTILDRTRRLILDNSTMLIAALVLVIGLLLIIESWRGRKQSETSRVFPIGLGNADTQKGPYDSKPDEQSSIDDLDNISGPDAPGLPDKVYAWLQFLDAESTRIPVSAAALRIGRHQDNDLCIPNKSVHRHHALLHRTSAGDFIIRDLGTKNGVLINGRRCAEHRLQTNDLIELGEVRLRFFLNGLREPGHSSQVRA